MFVRDKRFVKSLKWAVIGGVAADVGLLIGGYYCYRKMTHSRDFRYKIYSYDPRLVDVYYRANEKYGDGKARHSDYEAWGIKKIDSYSFIQMTGL
ncbi:uncharacterized protein LOC129230111 [Uloborus diversus]|uniref:uncharacterized protein LOC129230111 n=1 Tax=Uloborus diversus TaxID=327109 RepID=UPI00240A54F4|nr:uncharacterized protein LOC129230111 [Uloborus diversus]